MRTEFFSPMVANNDIEPGWPCLLYAYWVAHQFKLTKPLLMPCMHILFFISNTGDDFSTNPVHVGEPGETRNGEETAPLRPLDLGIVACLYHSLGLNCLR